MLFSRIVERPNARKILIDSTEIGIDADTVSPARNPTYTVTAPNKSPNSAPSTTARSVNSFNVSCVDTYVRNSAGGAVELHGRSLTNPSHYTKEVLRQKISHTLVLSRASNRRVVKRTMYRDARLDYAPPCLATKAFPPFAPAPENRLPAGHSHTSCHIAARAAANGVLGLALS
jgi:hypothetical protein